MKNEDISGGGFAEISKLSYVFSALFCNYNWVSKMIGLEILDAIFYMGQQGSVDSYEFMHVNFETLLISKLLGAADHMRQGFPPIRG